MLKTIKSFTQINNRKLEFLLFVLLIISLFTPWNLFANILISALGLKIIFIKASFHKVLKFIKSPAALLFIAFYLMHLIGLLHTQNMDRAGSFLEIRAATLIFPVLIWMSSIGKKEIKKLLMIFAYLTAAFALTGILYRVYYYFNITADTGYFYNDNIVSMFGFQAVYYAIYVNFAVFILLESLSGKRQKNLTISIKIITIVFLFVVNFLLASRTAMLGLYILSAIYILFLIIKYRKWKLGISVFAGGAALLVLLFLLFPKTIKRFESIKYADYDFENTNEINHFNSEIKEENWNGLNTRLAIWACANEVIEENFVKGVGTGDYLDELFKVYKKNKFYFGLESGYGTHNMYLQLLIMFGVFGLILFILSLIIPFIMALKSGEYLYAMFLLLFILAMLTEDVLARNKGVLLFSIFNSLLAFNLLPVFREKRVG